MDRVFCILHDSRLLVQFHRWLEAGSVFVVSMGYR